MSQNSDSCSCNDYSLISADIGIAKISSANPSLTGSGATTVFASSSNDGTIIKSVIIKAIGPVTTGMVRLYLTNATGAIGLYKEIPIPTTPVLSNTPTPAPMLQMFELCLEGELKLGFQCALSASTQNGESFNIIAEGLDWKYPASLPATCCNFKQDVANTGVGIISTANFNLDGTGTIVNIFTAVNSGNGSVIKTITIKALQSTNEEIVRIFVGPDSTHYSLMKEIYIPVTTQSGFEPSFKVVLEEDFHIPKGFLVGASTQNAQTFAITVEGIGWSYPIS